MAERWAPPLAFAAPTVMGSLRKLAAVLGRTPLYAPDRIVAASVTATDADEVLLVSATGAARTITWPDAKPIRGRRMTVVKTDGSVNPVTVQGTSGQTISGAASVSLALQWDRVTAQAALTTEPATYGWVRLD